MPVSGEIKLADANVWLAVAFSDHLHHAKAKAWFDSQGENSSAFCRITQMALLRHLTNSKIMGQFVQSQRDAWGNYQQLANDPRVVFLAEPTSLVEDAHAAGLKVHAYTFRAENQFLPKDLRSGPEPHQLGNLEDELKAYLNAGLDGFFTDHADFGVRARDVFV